MVSCDFGVGHVHGTTKSQLLETTPAAPKSLSPVDSATYNVIPFGEESPLHAERRMEINPADAVASPFGWHDVNGAVGPEFTTTRGNNVHAYPDRETGRDNDGSPDGEQADGGQELLFDFYYEDGESADTILQAAMVQSFYTNNKMHDFLYAHGFDEPAGNFQQNNYDRGGREGDGLRAEVQDGSATNNANFLTPADGIRPRMQMMLFNNGSGKTMDVLSPAGIAGPYVTGTADFGPGIDDGGPYEGDVAYASDGTGLANQVCNQVTNGGEIDGKIALLTRGSCNFEDKVFFAQEAGAIGVIVCNNVPGVFNMTSPQSRPITIPSLSMTRQDCALLRAELDAGINVRVKFEADQTPQRDSDFDAGVIAHEYAHGLSSRLIGGPAITTCLRNDEQVGEGWSDFFTLATTPQTLSEQPTGAEPRTIGAYSIASEIDGPGFRTQPYSTDFSVNSKLHHDIIYSGIEGPPHPLGEVWTAVLWDIYWFYADRDGFDEDLINGTGGNNHAVRLVIEGMKYTSCSPGILDARDGILEADRIVFGGLDRCALYELFAARGMGYSADQGRARDRTDNRSAFDVSPYCTGGITLEKTADTETTLPGESVSYTLTAFSYREAATEGVIVTDTVPEGMVLDQATIEGVENYEVAGNVITFDLGTMNFDQPVTIKYDAVTSEAFKSDLVFYDGLEEGGENWNVNGPGEEVWELTSSSTYDGNRAWFIRNDSFAQDQSLELIEPVTVEGERPALRFFTRYRTEAGWDAGLLELSTDRENWTYVEQGQFLRGAYRGPAAPDAIEPLADRLSFWGESKDGGYEEIIVDLSAYRGQEIYFRFRFVSDNARDDRGWWIDNVEVVDVFNYESGASLTSAAGDEVVARVGELGVYIPVSDRLINDVVDLNLGQASVDLFPNPAGESVNVRITAGRAGSAAVQLFTMEGRLVADRKLYLQAGANQLTLPTGQLPAGVYAVQVTGAGRVSTLKLTVK